MKRRCKKETETRLRASTTVAEKVGIPLSHYKVAVANQQCKRPLIITSKLNGAASKYNLTLKLKVDGIPGYSKTRVENSAVECSAPAGSGALPERSKADPEQISL